MPNTNPALITTVTTCSKPQKESGLARLTDLIAGYDTDMQRHIYVAVTGAVSKGRINGYKLSDTFELPHSKEPHRTVNKNDLAFESQDVPAVMTLLNQTVQRYTEHPTAYPTSRPSYEQLKAMTSSQKRQVLAQQRSISGRVR